MVTDKELLKEVTKELWHSVTKLRPGLPKEARTQLVLKALITIGDLANPIDAAMVVGTSLELETEREGNEEQREAKSETSSEPTKTDVASEGKRTVRRRSSTTS